MEKIYLSWNDIDIYIDEIAKNIITNHKDIKYLAGIPRGGMLIAYLLSYKTNLRVINLNDIDYRIEEPNNEIMLIDDIIDSGKTASKWMFMYNIHKVATIFKHKACNITPTIYIKESEKWIVFPWETEDDKLSLVNINNIEVRRERKRVS